ncbi:hypothetical protein KAH94_06600 [bacterium]|nr:hypothetical protein [bacterium]
MNISFIFFISLFVLPRLCLCSDYTKMTIKGYLKLLHNIKTLEKKHKKITSKIIKLESIENDTKHSSEVFSRYEATALQSTFHPYSNDIIINNIIYYDPRGKLFPLLIKIPKIKKLESVKTMTFFSRFCFNLFVNNESNLLHNEEAVMENLKVDKYKYSEAKILEKEYQFKKNEESLKPKLLKEAKFRDIVIHHSYY